MSAFLVDGQTRSLPVDEGLPLNDLMSYVRNHWSSETTLISAIWVNGKELSSLDEERLGGIPLSHIDSIEVHTAHPKEIAEETLQMMLTFLQGLEELSRVTSQMVGTSDAEMKFHRLVEGVGTFSEGMDTVKRILRLDEDTNFASMQVLEKEFVGILRDILTAKEHKDNAHLVSLLKQHLPENLARWRTDQIPQIIRSRDS